MEQTNLPSIISNSSLVSCKISSPTDIISNAKRFGEDYCEFVFAKYIKPTGIEKATSEKAPSFHDVSTFFSEKATLYWLRYHIAETFAFLGIYDTASAYQIRATAEMILSHEIFGQLTLSEFLCFLQRFKQGRYGKIYNSNRPNPQEFLMCLQPFWNELSHERGKAEERKRIEQLSEERKAYQSPTPEQMERIREIQEKLQNKFNPQKRIENDE